jgi:hypothetical protein
MKESFKKTPEGWLFSDEAVKEMTCGEQPLDNQQFCCTLLNDDGTPAKRETITASDYNHALGGCVALAHREHYPSGSVRRGAC